MRCGLGTARAPQRQVRQFFCNLDRHLSKYLLHEFLGPPSLPVLGGWLGNVAKKMRTKTWLCLAVCAASALTAAAQSNVYAINVVGYLNETIPARGYVMIANHLNTTNNSLAGLLPDVADGTVFIKFNGAYQTYTFDASIPGWTPDGDVTLNPGEGGFYQSPVDARLTFVGEVLQGTLTNTLPIGEYVIRSSIVPQAATPKVLGIPAEDGDTLHLLRGDYTTYTYDALAAMWLPNDPIINVGESFWYRKSPLAKTNLWIRTFFVQANASLDSPNLRLQVVNKQ